MKKFFGALGWLKKSKIDITCTRNFLKLQSLWGNPKHVSIFKKTLFSNALDMLNEKILWLPSILLFERTEHNLNHPNQACQILQHNGVGFFQNFHHFLDFCSHNFPLCISPLQNDPLQEHGVKVSSHQQQ